MYSCANYPRGCRGRCNTLGGKCTDCTVSLSGSTFTMQHILTVFQQVLNLRRPYNAFSPLAPNRDMRRPVRSVFAPQEVPDKTHEI